MEPNRERSIISQPSCELALPQTGVNRIIAEIVESSLALARERKSPDVVRLPIPFVAAARRDMDDDELLGCMALRPGGCAEFIDETGRVVIRRNWDSEEPFREGVAAIEQNGRWGFMDPTGESIIPPQWERVGNFSEGAASVQLGSYGIIDVTGIVVSQPQWTNVFSSTEGLIRVVKGQRWGFIDCAGNVVIEPKWYMAGKFREGLAAITMGDKNHAFIERRDGSMKQLKQSIIINDKSWGFID